jgi:hypothetical protein
MATRTTSKSKLDQYSNRALMYVQMTAANTITFEQVNFAVGTFQGIGLILNRIEMHPNVAAYRELVANTDSMSLAMTTRDDLANLEPANQAVIASETLVGMGAAVEIQQVPLVFDYTQLPGGGLILPANPLYVGLNTAGFAAAATARFVIFYQFRQLTDKEYLEIIQTLLPGNI